MKGDFFQMMGYGPFLQGVVIYLLIAVLFFLLIRELVTWYWKLNKIVSLLEKIEENTRKPLSVSEISKQESNAPGM